MIYTFYSFKGGVGRSMALANVAELLARRGLKVLMVDMDLEAPGLERFFEDGDYLVDAKDVQRHRGVMDLLSSYMELKRLPNIGDPIADNGAPALPVEPLREFVITLLETSGGSIMIVPAGQREGEAYGSYAEQVRTFDWDDFYLRWDGEAFFDWVREEAMTLADVVLVDSRTGITELSGICTFQLADAVLMFVAPNRQNLDGCELIAESLQAPTLRTEARKGRELKILAVPSRVDNSESEQLDIFAQDFTRRMERYVPSDLQFENSLFIDLKIPYVPAYAYRETIAVAEPDRAVATELIAAYGRLAATMVEMAPSSSRVQRLLQRSSRDDEQAAQEPITDVIPRLWVLEHVVAWLQDRRTPALLIVGEPGSGKTTFVRWLAGLYTGTELPGELLHVHYCGQSQDGDARPFVEALARRLGQSQPQYARLVRFQRNPNISVDVRANISATSDTRPFVDEVMVGNVPVATAFEELVCRPLPDDPTDEPLIVVVDGLDSAGSETKDSLVDLLGEIASGRLPSRLRFLITSRADPHVLRTVAAPTLDLIADQPPDSDDVKTYVSRQLAFLPSGTERYSDDELADRISERSGGNFQYAAALLSAVASGDIEDANVALPASISAMFRDELARRRARDHAAWQADRDVLGVLAVARGPVARSELAAIVGWPLSRLDEMLERWAPFLRVAPDDGVCLFHALFRDFLLSDTTAGVYADEAHQAIVRFLLEDSAVGWLPSERLYGVEQMLPHIVGGLLSARSRADRLWFASTVSTLLGDNEFLVATVSRGGSTALSEALVDGARELASLSRVPGIEGAIRSALVQLAPTLPEWHTSKMDPVSAVGEMLAVLGAAMSHVYAEAYDRIRAGLLPGAERTGVMSALINELHQLAERGAFRGVAPPELINGSDGERLVALVILKVQPDPSQFLDVCAAIESSHSAFEQYHALDVANLMIPLLSEDEKVHLLRVLDGERRDVRGLGVMDDSSRSERIVALMSRLLEEQAQTK